MPPTSRSRLLALARRKGTFPARDARRAGLHSQELTRLVAAGELERVARGQYRLADLPVTEFHAIALAAQAVPRGVICLLSALNIHGIGTQLPAEVWIAIARGARTPRLTEVPLRVMHFSAAAFTHGIERRRLDGVDVRVYSVAKTLADLFKLRNQVGLDVALEALREGWRDRKFTMHALDQAARFCRVEHVMRPYIEAVIG